MGLAYSLFGPKHYWIGAIMILGSLAIQEYIVTGRLLISPYTSYKAIFEGMSYGLSEAGYDVRLAQQIDLEPGGFAKGSIIEQLAIPIELMAGVYDKSSLARMGVAVQNTIIEPGWRGYLTVEISNHSREHITLVKGHPIAQLVFQEVRGATAYRGKYQDQGPAPQATILEE